MLFGSFVKQKRLNLGLTLRAFCKRYEHDAGNWSKMERGIIPPPKNEEILRKYAGQLRVEYGSAAWYEFSDLAHADSGIIPKDILDNESIAKNLPLFFRTVRGMKPDKQDLEKLIKIIERSP